MKFHKYLLLTIALAALLGLSACEFSLAADITPPPGASQATPRVQSQPVSSGPTYPLVAPNPSAGASIYAEKCAPCHGTEGMGDGPQAAQLPNPVPAIGRTDVSHSARPADWYNIVTNGNLERYMPPFQSLSEGQRWDVIAYVLSMSTTADRTSAGETLYQENCAACHGPEGAGDGPQAAGLSSAVTNFSDQQTMSQRSTDDLYQAIKNGSGQAMPAFADQLTDDEIWNLADYLRSLSFTSQPAASANAGSGGTAGSGTTSGNDGQAAVPPSGDTTSGSSSGSQNSQIGVVSGTVTNGSGGTVPSDITLTLHGLDNMQVVYTDTTTINADDTFAFDGVELPENRVYVVTTEFNGATFGSDVGVVSAGQDQIVLPVTVYDTTTDTSVLNVDRLHVFFDFSQPDVVQVVELYVISNPTNKTVVAAEDGGPVAHFTVPADATNLQFQSGSLDARYVKTDDGFADTASVSPGQGQYQVMYAFDMPYQRKMDLSQSFNMPVDAMIVMTPASGVSLRSDYLQSTGQTDVQGEAYETYTGGSLPVGQSMSFTLSGLPGASGVSSLLSTPTSSTSLIIGLGALGLVLVVAGVWLYRRNGRAQVTDEAEAEPVVNAPAAEESTYNDPETVMDAIIALDDLYASGELPEDVYLNRRAELKARLIELTQD
jgi:mono/diheme cytochrome c family protein